MPKKPANPVNKSLKKAITQYHEALKAYRSQGVKHEGALQTAFQQLLADVAKAHHCTLIPQQPFKKLRPDGTVRETLWDRAMGYWEAKDTDDDLDKEIAAKIEKGYPLTNIIFEDTRQAVLFQNKIERYRFDLSKEDQVASLLNEFFAYHEPDIDNFHQAVDEFKDRVPELAKGLVGKIDEAHKTNKKFQIAFDSFLTVCQHTLNPNISRAAVDEMLVQHLLTERLIRKIFDNPDFMHRNVIAAEIEKVIESLVGLSFNRDQFLKSLDRFYRAIEDAAHTLEDFAEKQHFLNTVYERFFQGYSVKVADTHGIIYTPQQIVDFMWASVEEVLRKEFNLTLGSKGVNILDPCTGTGNFIVNFINRISNRDLPRVYKEQLFANEVMLLPYYIAALNIEHAYFERIGQYEAFEGLCFVDTLDMAEHEQQTFSFMTVENTGRIKRQRLTPITVVIGNPPYNANQLNENDNNKNRTYPVIDKRVQETYVKDSDATLRNKLYDPYIKFFRWATDRLEDRAGVVCLVTNNGFNEGKAFDGFRNHLSQDFDLIFHFDMKGNARTTGERRRNEGGNVFSDKIRAGIGVTLLIRRPQRGFVGLYYHSVGDRWTAIEKTKYISSFKTYAQVPWQMVTLDSSNSWFPGAGASDFRGFLPMGSRDGNTTFRVFSTGAKSNRDDVVYDFNADELASRIKVVAENYNNEVDRYKRKGSPKNIDNFVDYTKVKWSSTLKRHLASSRYVDFDAVRIRTCLYRPFTKMLLYYDEVLNDRPGLFRHVLPIASSESENQIICCTCHPQIGFVIQITNQIANEAVGGRAGVCFPFYVYDEDDEDRSKRRENITNWALGQFRTHYNDPKIDKWAIFYYVYGLLHHPGYRIKFADNLKRELPRIPFAPDFKAFAKAGKEIARLHLDYEKLEPWDLTYIETEDMPLSYVVMDKMRLSGDKTNLHVNPSLTLAGIPAEVFQYRLGNRSALDWVINQYQVSVDKRSGIRSDPNRADDKQYIVNLVGQVVRVSVETVRIVNALPADFS
jgi:predicted helicase